MGLAVRTTEDVLMVSSNSPSLRAHAALRFVLCLLRGAHLAEIGLRLGSGFGPARGTIARSVKLGMQRPFVYSLLNRPRNISP